METDYGVDLTSRGLPTRLLMYTLHGLHPSEDAIRDCAWVEDRRHRGLCETPFSVRNYEFEDGAGGVWRQWICWCGEGTYVERINDAGV